MQSAGALTLTIHLCRGEFRGLRHLLQKSLLYLKGIFSFSDMPLFRTDPEFRTYKIPL